MADDAAKLAAIKEAERVHREKCEVRHCQGCTSPHCIAGRYVVKEGVK